MKMCELMERADPYFDATDQQSVRNKKLLAASMLVAVVFLAVSEFREDLPLLQDIPGVWLLSIGASVWAVWLIPYGLMPILMPHATAVSDVVARSGLRQGPDADQLAKSLLIKAEINRLLEKAPERAKVLWVRASRAIVSNDGSVSARNREIADLYRCSEAGYPLPSLLEKAARTEHGKQWANVFDALDTSEAADT